MSRKIITGMCLLGLVLSSVGCGVKADHSSPEAIASSFSKAVAKENWSVAFQCMTKESQDLMLLPVAFSGLIIKLAEKSGKDKEKIDALKAVLEKHGVDLDEKDSLKNVKDKGALFGDFVKWSEKYSDKDKKKKPFEGEVEFKDFKTDGDTATAKSKNDTIYFKKIDGKWYIDLVGSFKNKRK